MKLKRTPAFLAAMAVSATGLLLAIPAYAQISLLFPKSSRAAEATFRAYQTLTVLNDARAKIFADRLKKDYPKSDYAKQL